ncbi:MAG: tetratricopeptide repeat protein, partial [Bryobacteraceae bacterium]
FEGLAQVAKLEQKDPLPFLQKAIVAGSKSAPVYTAAAQKLPPAEALPLLKKAAQLNPLWAKPTYLEAKLTADPHRREALLKKAVQIDPRATPYWIELARVETTNGEASAAQGSWQRAEQSAPTPAESARIHQMRLASEKQRLDAEEAAARRERAAASQADQQAQDVEMTRIQAAEKAANRAVDTAAGDAPPEKAIPWSAAFPHRKLAGTLIAVDCLHTATRLSVKRRNGQTTLLLLRGGSRDGLGCGPQRPARRVSIVYAAQPDDSLHTAGTVVSLRLQ